MREIRVSLLFCTCSFLLCCYAENTALDVAAKCKNILLARDIKPRIYSVNDTLRVVIPWKKGYKEFVNFRPDTCIVDGFSVQVFLQALYHMQQHSAPLAYQFVVHGNGTYTPAYDEMLDMLVRNEVDIVVADLTITKERAERVAFTAPHMPSSLAMVTTYSYGSARTVWEFAKPFSTHVWLALLGSTTSGYSLKQSAPDALVHDKDEQASASSFRATHTLSAEVSAQHDSAQNELMEDPTAIASTSAAAYKDISDDRALTRIEPSYEVREDRVRNKNIIKHDSFSALQPIGVPIYDEASISRRITNSFWFTSMCVFQSQQESVRTHLGRIVTVMWLFLMLLFNSSYTASLASLLSAEKRFPSIKSFSALQRDANIPIGYQRGSFMEHYLKNLQMDENRLEAFDATEEFDEALRKGPGAPGGIGAALDELPYVQILVRSQCALTIASNIEDGLPTFGGFGFALRKGDPLVDEISKMILELGEAGTLQMLQNGLNVGSDKNSECGSDSDIVPLGIKSFAGLFGIIACVYLLCVLLRTVMKSTKCQNLRELSLSPIPRSMKNPGT
ncbi:hypothetical protein KP509_15G018800 [Ceratopteris richardii]|uniref:Ionotropic glutamate receptor C-terminal domain-containing protein n=1 Tax=Ceratopteris richardii TaxID=49495 RepID=A0A8T2T7E4_CERRI|nr:hypothetical protein KP509_15G018800 [Ceratopteris richardii]